MAPLHTAVERRLFCMAQFGRQSYTSLPKIAFCHMEIISFTSSQIHESALLLNAFKYSFPLKLSSAQPHVFGRMGLGEPGGGGEHPCSWRGAEHTWSRSLGAWRGWKAKAGEDQRSDSPFSISSQTHTLTEQNS